MKNVWRRCQVLCVLAVSMFCASVVAQELLGMAAQHSNALAGSPAAG